MNSNWLYTLFFTSLSNNTFISNDTLKLAKIKQKLSSTLKLNCRYLKIVHFLHPRLSSRDFDAFGKRSQKSTEKDSLEKPVLLNLAYWSSPELVPSCEKIDMESDSYFSEELMLRDLLQIFVLILSEFERIDQILFPLKSLGFQRE